MIEREEGFDEFHLLKSDLDTNSYLVFIPYSKAHIYIFHGGVSNESTIL